ncbi:MAG: hypothetical protein KAH03_01170, partial [Cocleimonas sp.]|nr:hypothetical protein [Cocleimonas sp.]
VIESSVLNGFNSTLKTAIDYSVPVKYRLTNKGAVKIVLAEPKAISIELRVFGDPKDSLSQ